jgi:chromosome segregation ATPase
MWDESRRSSFSSLSSDTTKRRSYSPGNRSSTKVLHTKSLPAINQSMMAAAIDSVKQEKSSYPTPKAAQERIEFLEKHVALLQEQLDKKNMPVKEYQTAIQNMSSHIDQFLSSRKTPIITVSDTKTKLHQLKEMIDNKGHTDDLLNFVQTWMTGIDSPNTVQGNVSKEKNQRLVEALQKLSKQQTQLKKKLKLVPKLEQQVAHLNTTMENMSKKHAKETDNLNRDLKDSREEISEAEQLLDDLRREMEIMLEEMDQVKQEREQYANSTQRLKEELGNIAQFDTSTHQGTGQELAAMEALLRESETQLDELEEVYNEQLTQIEKLREESRQFIDSQRTMQRDAARRSAIHESEVSALNLEKEELRKRLISSEKSVTDLQKKVKAAPQQDTELELVLRRTVAERDGQLAKLNVALEKKERQIEQIGASIDQRMKKELETRHSELVYELETRYKKESDIFKLQSTREIRTLSCQVGELESELELRERQEMDQQTQFIKAKLDKVTAEDELKSQTDDWTKTELELKQSIAKLEQKIETMENEALCLYSKSLNMAQKLGELED